MICSSPMTETGKAAVSLAPSMREPTTMISSIGADLTSCASAAWLQPVQIAVVAKMMARRFALGA